MTPNTHYPKNDAPDAVDDDATSSNYFILYYYLKRKTDPKSMPNIKKLK